ncbi:hypothetical protein K7X08_006618 [Anisodus acutangulus]|uniref:Uncharacterized protein n=1 Tax=Anisodus acutangulus TaxID=402998 RepID=A0A9Q1RRL6_9SOLA|nr:hypothetical protein K7X08_006618 [Anisodus acutangulus]
MGNVGINKGNSSSDTLMASTEEIHERGDLSGELTESEIFYSHLQIESFQNTAHDSGIPSHEGTHISVDEKSVSAPSDAGLSSAIVGVGAVIEKNDQFDDLQTSQELVSFFQFELSDEFLPSQISTTKIVMTLHKERCPRPHLISPT